MPRWVQARKGNDPLPHPPLSCSPSRFSVSLQLNLVSSLRGFRFGPVLFVLWRPLDPGSASPQSGFLQHHRLLRGWGWGGLRGGGRNRARGGSERLRLGWRLLSHPPARLSLLQVLQNTAKSAGERRALSRAGRC